MVIDGPTEVIPGAYLTRTIGRVTPYERSSPIFFIEDKGKIVEDRFSGEQALVFLVKGRGLVIVSGCAHAGIVNTVRHARHITGWDHVYVLLGGFHLVNAPDHRIEATIADIKALAADYMVPMHCTGFEAMLRFREEMPDQFLLNTVGTTYNFGESGRKRGFSHQ